MSPFIRLYIRQTLLGIAVGLMFSMLVIGLNVGNLRHLIGTVEGGFLIGLVFAALNAIVFGGAAMGAHVFLSSDRDTD